MSSSHVGVTRDWRQMDGILQNWEIWTLIIAIQAGALIFGHFLIRDKYLNYWMAGLIGVVVWVAPLMKYAPPGLLRAGRGVIINIFSAGSRSVPPLHPAAMLPCR